MFGNFKNKALRLCVAFIVLFGSTAVLTNAQSSPTPFLQPITVQPSPTPKSLIQKTGSVTPVNRADVVNPSDIVIPGNSGVLVETLDGKVIKESSSNFTFNPASNVKIATVYAVIKTFGPNYRFPTNVFTDGEIDKASGTLNGNLYVSGRDPVFTLEHAVALADGLNRLGIRNVNGDLIVTYSFIMALNNSTQSSANNLKTTLDSGRRSSAALKAWQNYLAARPQASATVFPSVSISGKTYVDVLPTNAKLLFAHESATLKEIVKITMCYSNNFLAEKLGDMVGGAAGVARIVRENTNTPPEEFILQTSSGLGSNRVTPRAMMRLLHKFRGELAKHKMNFADVMPIAGVDPGTLEKRLNSYGILGSVVGKTGTLGYTDGGASSLSGEMQTKQGKLLFVIFNTRGNNSRFRKFQDDFVMSVQNEFGGAAPLGYTSPALFYRMADSRLTFPNTQAKRTD